MEYEMTHTCARGPADIMPAEDLTNMLHETRTLAHETRKLADRIDIHLFGRRNEAACSGEAKCADPNSLKELLADTRFALRDTVEDLAKMCTLIGI